jgi:hypothetical protein
LFFLPYIEAFKPRTVKWVVHVACTGDGKNAYTILGGLDVKSEGRRPFESPVK